MSKKMQAAAILAGASMAALGHRSARADLSGFTTFAPVNTYVNNAAVTNTNNGYTGGTTFQLNDGNGSEATSGFASTAQNVTSFTTSFTYQVTGTTSSATTQYGLGDGFDFVLQNDPRGTAAIGGGGGSKGYSNAGTGSPAAIAPSAAIGFEVYGGNTTSVMNTAAGSATTSTIASAATNVNGGFTNHDVAALTSGDPINVTLTYGNGQLTESLFDTTTRGTFNQTFTGVNMPSLVGGSTALVGFSGGTGGATLAQQITNFKFNATNGAAFTPIPLTAASFTQDGVVAVSEAGAPAAGITATMDGGTAKTGATWYEVGANTNNTSTGLPASGSTFTAAANHTFQMQSYTGNNVLLLTNTSSGTMTFATPRAESVLSLLMSAGSGPAPVSMTVNYQNGTSTTIANLVANDWFYTNSSAISAGGRVSPSNGAAGFETDGANPNVYQVDVPLTDTTDPIASVNLTYTGTNTGTNVFVFALSGSNAVAAVPEPTTAAVAAVAATGLFAGRRRRRARRA